MCCSTRNTFYPFEGKKIKQHLEKRSGMNKKQLQAIVATSHMQSASTGILGAAPRAGKRREAQWAAGCLAQE